jgi:NAD-dependent deacetylase
MLATDGLFAITVAKTMIANASNIVFFTGAGISAESGISTFRDPETGALWDKFDPEVMSSMKGFEENPALVWEWYDAIFERMSKAEPNLAHKIIGDIDCSSVKVITQNIDDLHERAGSNNVIHLHGKCTVKCTTCDFTGKLSELVQSENDPVPTCPACSSIARPDVVWFGEMLPTEPFLEAREAILAADVVIVIGTSGQVQPAASLPGLAFGKVISINTRKIDHSVAMAINLTGKASDILSTIFSSA